jgi:hypothetical protein
MHRSLKIWSIDQPVVEKIEKRYKLVFMKMVVSYGCRICHAIRSGLRITEDITKHFRVSLQKELMDVEESTVHLFPGMSGANDEVGLDARTAKITVPSSK